VAGSLLHAVGLPELVVDSVAEYERLAVRLATNSTLLGKFRKRLTSNRLSSPLFDGPRFARHIESAYVTMWQRWCDGLPPEAFTVNPTLGKLAPSKIMRALMSRFRSIRL
jgi:hypothetical protein